MSSYCTHYETKKRLDLFLYNSTAFISEFKLVLADFKAFTGPLWENLYQKLLETFEVLCALSIFHPPEGSRRNRIQYGPVKSLSMLLWSKEVLFLCLKIRT